MKIGVYLGSIGTMSVVYYEAEVANYPDSYFLSPLPPRHPTPTVLPPR